MFSEDSETEHRSTRKINGPSKNENKKRKTAKKKRNFRIDSSESESDSSFERIKLIRKKIRVVNSDSDSSGSEVIPVRKTKKVMKIIDEDVSDSDSSWSLKSGDSLVVDGKYGSSTSRKEDKCPICLNFFKNTEIGLPNNCNHVFCFTCIEIWSKNVNTCPIDRIAFDSIQVKDKLGGVVVRIINVDACKSVLETPFENFDDHNIENLSCEICGSPEHGENMLLCDGCNLGFHMLCLEPAWYEVPEGEWFCPTCSLYLSRESRNETNFRTLPRTRQNVRIMRRIRRHLPNNRRKTKNVKKKNSPITFENINTQRIRAGIPRLHLFGNSNDLDYFSHSDSDSNNVSVSEGCLLMCRPSHPSHRIRNVKAKQCVAPPDLLDCILDLQMKLYSKNYTLSIVEGGQIKLNEKNLTVLARNAPLSAEGDSTTPSSTNCDQGSSETQTNRESVVPVTDSTLCQSEVTSPGGSDDKNEPPIDYSLQEACGSKEKKKDAYNPEGSDSELDIYSDIEAVTTSKGDEGDAKGGVLPEGLAGIEDGNENESDNDLVIDDTGKVSVDSEKYDPACVFESDDEKIDAERAVSSTVNTTEEGVLTSTEKNVNCSSNAEIQSNTVQSSSNNQNVTRENTDDEDTEQDCPNFSIYSTESIIMAKSTDLAMLSALNAPKKNYQTSNGLYSDSEDESLVKIDRKKPFGISDLQTEDISEDERSYTPCLDEKEQPKGQGLEGLDTEMISDDDKNDFEDANDLKTISDGDALEINAKESELDFSRPEDCEEGEIVVEKSKEQDEEIKEKENQEGSNKENESKEERKEKNEAESKENQDENCSSALFKRISKNTRERNYRENRSRSRSRSRDNKKKKKLGLNEEKKKRKEIEIYNVRSILSEKPRKDKFGRDLKRVSSNSDSSSGSVSPPPKSSRANDTPDPPQISRKVRKTSRSCSRHRHRSYSQSPSPKRSLSKSRRGFSKEKKKSKREEQRSRSRRRSSRDRRKKTNRSRSNKKKRRKSSRDISRSKNKSRSRSRRRERSISPRGWTPSLSPSSPYRHVSPSWTPPRLHNQPPLKPQNLTVILTNNETSRKNKDKKKRKIDKKGNKDGVGDKNSRKRKRDKSPLPSKEVFASGNNILVSVSFNKDAENTRDVQTTRKRYETSKELTTKRLRKEKERERERIRKKSTSNNNNSNKSDKIEKRQKLANVKPVAIIDLELSPFRELTPSPQNVIVLSDSENGDSNDLKATLLCDSSSQQISSPPPSSLAGPKTPPEPQVKFSLNSKQSQMRPIVNPLHEPDEEETNQEKNVVVHKGPNTPPEPPTSPPSSPDAYDPFDPTKSRTPTPEPSENAPQTGNNVIPGLEETNNDAEKGNMGLNTAPADVRPADSQSSLIASTPDNNNVKMSPERSIRVVINQVVQTQPSAGIQQPLVPCSTPVTGTRINLISSTILPTSNVSSSSVIMPQRISLPLVSRASPSPSKMVPKTASQNLDLDSPYSPRSSDYEDLFEPPPDTGAAAKNQKSSKTTGATPKKSHTSFDQLFGSSPQPHGKNKNKKSSNMKGKSSKGSSKVKTAQTPTKGTKLVGVKMDEDNLKILDELPNSAVEMQVKDKFLKKLNRQERVVEEVKLVLKPHYNKKHVTKEEYKDILRRAVPKICHNKSGEINPKKIQALIEAYVRKIRHSKKVTSSSSVNPQKTEVISNWLSKINK